LRLCLGYKGFLIVLVFMVCWDIVENREAGEQLQIV
jgi:hypothetical protein